MVVLYVSIALFGITTVIGMYLSSLALQDKQTPKGLIILHGLFTIIGFTLLINYGWPALLCALFFAVATGCGLILLYQDLTTRKFTTWLCFAHAVLTLAGFGFLVMLVP